MKANTVTLNVTQLLARILNANQSTQKEILTKFCGEEPEHSKKSKRIAVVPGKSVSIEDIAKEYALDVLS